MGCTSCGTKGGTPAGCKSNGSCGTGGCSTLNVYDWFKDMELPTGFGRFNIVEVRFKGSRKEYFKNTHALELYTGDRVVTESSLGYDIGTVSATGEIVRLQLRKLRLSENSEKIMNIIRVATERDLEKLEEVKSRENHTLERARTISFDLNLAMKLSDIEIQGDGRKAIFFYTAENRVDFRELIRRFADEFKLKIEMRHISYREEASRLGGIGDCGRQLCCSTWLTDYKLVTTGAARVQNLSMNMEKLAGQCGRLKCCLNYELDTYVEALNEFPKAKIVKLDTEAGMAVSRKTDILKQLMWFSYEDNPQWIPLTVAKVKEIMAMNREGVKGPALGTVAVEMKSVAVIADEPEMIGNNELLEHDSEREDMRKTRELEERNKDKRNNNNNRRNKNKNREAGPRPVQGQSDQQKPRNPRPPQNQQNPQNRNNNNQPRENRGPSRPRTPHKQHKPNQTNRKPPGDAKKPE